ncbi:MAG: 30S ribosomal protein S8 [Candidatus Pacearchaeota archaeon]
MSQDIIADVLNKIMNAKRRKKTSIVVTKYSKFLLNVLELAKKEGYIENFGLRDKKLEIRFNEKLNKCNAIKPRFFVKKDTLEKYVRRYLPARDFGFLVVSTNKGLITHEEAIDKKIGGCLIAYFY